MRKLDVGTKRYTEVVATDEPGFGGACHDYEILSTEKNPKTPQAIFGSIYFQNGPVKENGINGCHQEDLLVIVIDRLQCFQRGDFSCKENALALTAIEEALYQLRRRTDKRIERGVEGTNTL